MLTDLEVVALQNHGDDVLADVVHVALDGGNDDLAPCWRRPGPASCWRFSSSMKGTRWATACFITRDFTTWGNILPAPNRSPTMFMPSISGPSMTMQGRPGDDLR